MPVLVPCNVPGCAALVPIGGTCPDHPVRATRQARGYTAEWLREAARFKIEYPYCGDRPLGQRPVMSACYDAGRPTPAYAVDHVVPHRNDPALMWDEIGNWQSLCAACHAAKTRAGL